MNRLKKLAVKILIRAIKARFAFRPIFVERAGRPETFDECWLRSVTYREDPDGVRFFIRAVTDREARMGDKGRPLNIRVLDYQDIASEKGRFVYRKPDRADSSNHEDFSEPSGTPRSRFDFVRRHDPL